MQNLGQTHSACNVLLPVEHSGDGPWDVPINTFSSSLSTIAAHFRLCANLSSVTLTWHKKTKKKCSKVSALVQLQSTLQYTNSQNSALIQMHSTNFQNAAPSQNHLYFITIILFFVWYRRHEWLLQSFISYSFCVWYRRYEWLLHSFILFFISFVVWYRRYEWLLHCAQRAEGF